MDANNGNYFIKLNIENQSFRIAFRDFNIKKYDGVEYKGNSIIVINKEHSYTYTSNREAILSPVCLTLKF